MLDVHFGAYFADTEQDPLAHGLLPAGAPALPPEWQPFLEWWELVRAWLCVPRAQFYARGGFERRVKPNLSLK